MPSKFKGLFSSNTPVWSTPQKFFDEVNAEFGPFTLDPCANPDNAKCPKFFTEADDGLAQDWSNQKVWLNPPCGKNDRALTQEGRRFIQEFHCGMLAPGTNGHPVVP